MPLVFVHGVANRPSAEKAAATSLRNALFRKIVFANPELAIFNPDWGTHAVSATDRWLPPSSGMQAFGSDTAPSSGGVDLGLGHIARIDALQATDLIALGALEHAILEANRGQVRAQAAQKDALRLAQEVAAYQLEQLRVHGASWKGSDALAANSDKSFVEALEVQLECPSRDLEAFGLGSSITNALKSLGNAALHGASDAALRARRKSLSQGTALFLGDIFVYLRNRDSLGPTGTAERIFKPILDTLVAAASAPRLSGEPLVVVGHSLGGVILYDMLTDRDCLGRLQREAEKFKIDCWLTVGSQPGFFADLEMYRGKKRTIDGRYLKPDVVSKWLNVLDYTDVFSFLCKPFFSEVEDFVFDTKLDLVRAHSAYFQRPSFYVLLRRRLLEMGFS